MTITAHRSKYSAHDLTRWATNGMDRRLSLALSDAAGGLSPHQIEVALFALRSPLSKGVILADEVGLGKAIEAGIVLCQLWAERGRKRRLLIICPASIQTQSALELDEKDASDRHGRATISRSLEQNSRPLNEARESLEPWADDMVLPAENALLNTNAQIRVRKRQARQEVTLAEQHEIQEKIRHLERRQRPGIFKAEDQIIEKRDLLIDSWKHRLTQRTETETLFTIRRVVE